MTNNGKPIHVLDIVGLFAIVLTIIAVFFGAIVWIWRHV